SDRKHCLVPPLSPRQVDGQHNGKTIASLLPLRALLRASGRTRRHCFTASTWFVHADTCRICNALRPQSQFPIGITHLVLTYRVASLFFLSSQEGWHARTQRNARIGHVRFCFDRRVDAAIDT